MKFCTRCRDNGNIEFTPLHVILLLSSLVLLLPMIYMLIVLRNVPNVLKELNTNFIFNTLKVALNCESHSAMHHLSGSTKEIAL